MNIEKRSITRHKNFYEEFSQTNPYLISGLLIISLGLYMINWIYVKNKEFEKLDDLAPDALRGAIIMMILPLTWFFITIFLKLIIFSPENLVIQIIEIVGWGLLFLLIIKYLLDFCISFGRITQTNGFLWIFTFIIGVTGIIFTMYQKPFGLILILIMVLAIPAMQAELNLFYNRITRKKEKQTFYD